MRSRQLTAMVAASVAFAGGLPFEPAQAASTTATIAVSATVLAYCTVGATPLAFGNYSPNVQSTASTAVTVLCTANTPYNIGLDAGTGSGASVANRLMNGASGATLGYSLYTTSALSTVWGNTVNTDTMSSSGTGLPQAFTVYGRIPSGQNVAPGLYTDVITVTLTY